VTFRKIAIDLARNHLCEPEEHCGLVEDIEAELENASLSALDKEREEWFITNEVYSKELVKAERRGIKAEAERRGMERASYIVGQVGLWCVSNDICDRDKLILAFIKRARGKILAVAKRLGDK